MVNLEKTVNVAAIVLLLALAGVALVVMQKTTESNAVVAKQAAKQSKKKSKVAREVRLLSLELRNLQKDLAQIRELVKKEEEKSRKGVIEK